MSLNAAAIALMRDKGLSLDDVVEIATAMEVRRDPTAADRMARLRSKRKAASVTRNVTDEPPNDNISNPPPLAKAKSESARGTRLPDDFSVPEDWLSWAMTKRRWSRADAIEEAEQFCRYWQAKAGAGATKRDWFKTWQQWATNSRRAASATAPAAEIPPAQRAETMRRTAVIYRRQGRDLDAAQIEREAERLMHPSSIGSLIPDVKRASN